MVLSIGFGEGRFLSRCRAGRAGRGIADASYAGSGIADALVWPR